MLEFDGTFIFALISFITFVFLMNLILYRPIQAIISKRQKFYDKNFEIVANSKKKAEELSQYKEAEILNAKKQASDYLKDTQNDIKLNRDNALEAKKNEISSKLQENFVQLNCNSQNIKRELRYEVENYVRNIISKVLCLNIQDVKIDSSIIDGILEVEK